MKKVILVLSLLFTSSIMVGQVGIGTLNPNASAELEVKSTNRGVIIPRVNLVNLLQLTPIIGPGEESLLVYNLTIDEPNNLKKGYYYWKDNKWERIINSNEVADIVIQNFDNIVSNVDVLNQLIEIIHQNETITTLTDNGDGTFTYVNEAGTSTTIDIADLVTDNETITTLVNNNDGTYTYTSENGTTTTINVPADVINNFSSIVSNIDVLNQLIEIIHQNETVTTLTDNGDGTITYVNEAGTSTTVDIADLVSQNETITTLVNNNDGTFSYTNEAGAVTTINFGGANNWKLNGNEVVDGDFIGSTNQKPLVIKTNNTDRVIVKADGMVGVGTSNPLSTFTVNGSVAHTLTSLTSSYTATSSDYALVYKHTTPATLTLPSASANPGRVYLIINHGNQNLSISPAIQTAFSQTTASLSSGVGTHAGIVYGNRLKVQSDGTEWILLEN